MSLIDNTLDKYTVRQRSNKPSKLAHDENSMLNEGNCGSLRVSKLMKSNISGVCLYSLTFDICRLL